MTRWFSPIARVGALLACLLAAPPNCWATTAPRTSNLWWMPENASAGGVAIDHLIYFILFLTGAVFVATQIVYIFFLIKYRARRGVPATYSHGNNRLEIIWTAIPTAIFIGLWGYSNHLWSDVLHAPPPSNSLEINVAAYQFGFSFQYAGADGKLGRSEARLVSNDNMFGNDPNDPDCKDNFISTILELPVNRPVHVRLASKDVIHAFYVPQFRLYQDILPGRIIDWVWFTPTKIGSYQLACSQLCGSGHYNMKAEIEVVSQADFDKWYNEKAKASSSAKPAANNSSPGKATADKTAQSVAPHWRYAYEPGTRNPEP
jgi:cytochrome c oxidase subunit II